jgi:hypothetical protein
LRKMRRDKVPLPFAATALRSEESVVVQVLES